MEIRELQRVVEEKDELLKILTERLELAAEQLDRLRRQGGALEPVSSLPAAGALGDPELTDDLRQMLSDWSLLQKRGWFESLEERLDGIHNLVTNLDAGVERRASEPDEANTADSRSSSVAEILARYNQSSAPAASVPVETEYAQTEQNIQNTEEATSPEPLQLPDAPEPVDIDHCSTEELRQALRDRETYILRLRDYLLAYDAANDNSAEPIGGGNLTLEQRTAMETWEARVRKELRQTQIQLWVERAQLSREQMQLQQQQQQLEAEVKKLGISKQKLGGLRGGNGSDVPGEQNRSKNWLGLFGKQ